LEYSVDETPLNYKEKPLYDWEVLSAEATRIYRRFPGLILSLNVSVGCEDRGEKARNNAEQNYPRAPHCAKG